MILRSIKGRLLSSLSLALLLCLALGGFALDRAFRSSIETGIKEKLKADFYALLAEADTEAGALVMPPQLQNPLFNQFQSGLYAVIVDAQGLELWRSPSALAANPPSLPDAETGRFRFHRLQKNGKDTLFSLSFGIIWELEDGSERRYGIHLLQSAHPALAEIGTFRSTLWRWFGGIALTLVLLQGVATQWGLSPLRRLARELGSLESGQEQQLGPHYPTELQPVTRNLNLLIDNERRQRQRYRNKLADLAHSLKTPLAILRNLPSTQATEEQRTLQDQVSRMDQIIGHQLQRASASASTANHNLSLQPVALAPLAEKILRSLAKVYADRELKLQNQLPPQLSFRADARDLMEVLGNLLDNACKAAASHVRISGRRIEATGKSRPCLQLDIEDDGQGIPEAQREPLMQRGNRADKLHPGQGIGLAVSRDIIASYGGRLSIEASALGGARVHMELPLP